MSTPGKECCSAGSLEDVLKHLKGTGGLENKGKLSKEALSYICSQLGSALMYVHEFNLVHRDVKSENVLLGQGCAATRCNSCISK